MNQDNFNHLRSVSVPTEPRQLDAGKASWRAYGEVREGNTTNTLTRHHLPSGKVSDSRSGRIHFPRNTAGGRSLIRLLFPSRLACQSAGGGKLFAGGHGSPCDNSNGIVEPALVRGDEARQTSRMPGSDRPTCTLLAVLACAALLVAMCVMAARCWDADSYPAQVTWKDLPSATVDGQDNEYAGSVVGVRVGARPHASRR